MILVEFEYLVVLLCVWAGVLYFHLTVILSCKITLAEKLTINRILCFSKKRRI